MNLTYYITPTLVFPIVVLAAMFCRMVREGRITLADEENPGI